MRRILVLSVVVFGCATAGPPPRMPPPLAFAPAAPVPVVAEPLRLDDPDLLAVLRVHKPLSLLEQLGFGGDKLRSLGVGIDARDLHGETVIAAVLAPLAGKRGMPSFFVLVPAAASSRLMEAVRSGGFQVSAAGADSIVTSGKGDVERALALAPVLADLAKAPLQEDLSLQIEMKRLLSHYGTDLLFVEDDLRRSGPDKASEIAWLRWAYKTLAEVDSATVAITSNADGYDVSWASRPATPKNVGAPLPEPSSLVRLLPPGAFRLVATGQTLRKASALLKDLQQVIAAHSPAATHWSKSAPAWEQVAPGTVFAFSAQLSAEKIAQWSEVFHSSQADRILELLRTPTPGGAALCAMSESKKSRLVAGWPVYEHELRCSDKPGASAVARSVSARMYPFHLETARIGDYVIATGGYESRVLDDIAFALLDGRAQSTPLTALSSFPQSGFFHADVDVPVLVNTILRLDDRGRRWPVLDAGTPPMTVTAYDDGLAAEYRVRVPAQLAAAIARFVHQGASMMPAKQR